MPVKKILLQIFLLFLIAEGYAQQIPVFEENLTLEPFKIGEGREINLIYDILQDRFGFLWFGTFNGLVRYDGYNLKHYRPRPLDSTAVQAKLLLKLLEDASGNIWALSGHGLIHQYDHYTDDFQIVKDLQGDSLVRTPEFGSEIMIADDAGNVWIADQHGLLRLRKGQKEKSIWVKRYLPNSAGNSEDENTVNVLMFDNRNGLWLGTKGGLFYFDIPNERMARIRGDCDVSVISLAKTSSGKICMGTNENGFCYFDPATNSCVNFLPGQGNGSIAGNTVKDIAKDGKGNIWLFAGDRSTLTFSLQRLDLEQGVFQTYFTPFPPRGIMGGSNVRLFIDGEGFLWVITGTGLLRFDPNQEIFTDFSKNEDFDDWNLFTRIFQDNTGILWFGTFGNGLVKHVPSASKFNVFVYPKKEGEKRASFIDLPIYEDSRGYLWAGTHYGTIRYAFNKHNKLQKVNSYPFISGEFRENEKGELFIRTDEKLKCFDLDNGTFKPGIAIPFSVTSPFTFSLIDNAGRFWFNTFGKGLFSYHPISGEVNHFLNDPDQVGCISSNFLNPSAMQDRDGDIWLTNVNGLDKLNPQSGTFSTFLEGLPVMHMYQDQNGYLWLSTNGHGLYRFDKKTGSSKQYNSENGFPFQTLFYLLEDDHGGFWISSDVGLIWFEPETETFRLFDKSDGIPEGYFAQSMPCKRKNGEIFFPLLEGGFIRFHPDSLALDKHPPATVIVDFKLWNRETPIGSSNSPLSQTIWTTDQIVLKYNQNVFSIEYAAMHFAAPAENHFAYILEGVDNNWNEVGDQRILNFAGLAPGEYTFRVKSTNPDGYIGKESTLRLTILPPWWITNWAIGLYLLLFGLSLWGVFAFLRNRWKLKAQLAIEQREADRLKELDQIKAKLYTNITHEFRTPLTIILGMTDQLEENPKQWFSEGLQMIRRNVNSLLQFVNRLLELSKLEAGGISTNFIQGEIIRYLKYILESFHSMAVKKQIELSFESNLEELWMDYDPEIILQITSNLISNAIKFTPTSGKVQFAIRTEKFLLGNSQNKVPVRQGDQLPIAHCLLLTVTDTGIGIPSEKLPHIFDRFYQADQMSINSDHGVGIGLAMTKELVKLLNGEIKVESKTGRGTKFIVKLPITRTAPIIQSGETAPFGKIDLSRSLTSIEKEDVQLEIVEQTENAPVLLIVEDNIDVIKFLISFLNNSYHIEVAKNGQEGWDKALQLIPDIVISDVMMPVMDGLELCDHLKKDMRTSHIPVILLTSKADIASRIQGLERGADAYLTKPFDRKELLVRIKKLVQLRSQLQTRYRSFISPISSDDPDIQKEDDFIKKLHGILEARFSEENFGVPELCDALLMSRAQLYRKLTALTGKPVASYLRSFRLQKAKKLLQTTSLTVSEVAFQVGFKDIPHFSRSFQKEFGVNPSKVDNG